MEEPTSVRSVEGNRVRRVLFSLSDKSGLQSFASGLRGLGCELLATSSTRDAIEGYKVDCASVEDLTAFPQILGGRVKTLHPAVFGGILARRDKSDDQRDLEKHHLKSIDLVVCNLYPFQATLSEGASLNDLVEKIDIGGVSLLRAAAKNHAHVGIVCDPRDYEVVLTNLRENQGTLSLSLRQALALKALRETAAYDAAISAALGERFSVCGIDHLGPGPVSETLMRNQPPGNAIFPSEVHLTLQKVRELRYGENPHQKAALYSLASGCENERRCNIAAIESEHGKQLSYNNVLDVEHAVRLVHDFPSPVIAVIKHNTPCVVAVDAGQGSSRTLADLFSYGLQADPVSPFGGIVCLNRPVDVELAQRLNEVFLEVVVAPEFTPEARRTLEQKKNLRLITLDPSAPLCNRIGLTSVQGGFLLQSADTVLFNRDECEIPTRQQPSSLDLDQMEFAFRVVKHVRSNAIVIAKEGRILAVAGGFTNRVDAVEQCLKKARVPLTGAVLASDAFFPFPDSVELLAGSGISSIIQPGGSLRDRESIEACDRLGIAMVLTKMRHFKH